MHHTKKYGDAFENDFRARLGVLKKIHSRFIALPLNRFTRVESIQPGFQVLSNGHESIQRTRFNGFKFNRRRPVEAPRSRRAPSFFVSMATKQAGKAKATRRLTRDMPKCQNTSLSFCCQTFVEVLRFASLWRRCRPLAFVIFLAQSPGPAEVTKKKALTRS